MLVIIRIILISSKTELIIICLKPIRFKWVLLLSPCDLNSVLVIVMLIQLLLFLILLLLLYLSENIVLRIFMSLLLQVSMGIIQVRTRYWLLVMNDSCLIVINSDVPVLLLFLRLEFKQLLLLLLLLHSEYLLKCLVLVIDKDTSLYFSWNHLWETHLRDSTLIVILKCRIDQLQESQYRQKRNHHPSLQEADFCIKLFIVIFLLILEVISETFQNSLLELFHW